MNFGSDERVRNAFRATLLDEPSSSNLGTQEIDAADVLEVTDLATAIAKAEEAIRAQSSRKLFSGPDSSGKLDGKDESAARSFDDRDRSSPAMDMFDRLVATDDTSGPALPALYEPALLTPPAWLATPPAWPALATTAAPPDAEPRPETPIPPALRTAPILILDEDAFYHPAGRIRSLADVTLDGYRPEPTLMVRLRQRRQALVPVVLGVLAAISLFALFAAAVGFGRARAARRLQPQVTSSWVAAPNEAPAAQRPTPAATGPAAKGPTADVPARLPELPVLDVNSLKSAPPAKPQH